jgi:hypothetical protein
MFFLDDPVSLLLSVDLFYAFDAFSFRRDELSLNVIFFPLLDLEVSI